MSKRHLQKHSNVTTTGSITIQSLQLMTQQAGCRWDPSVARKIMAAVTAQLDDDKAPSVCIYSDSKKFGHFLYDGPRVYVEQLEAPLSGEVHITDVLATGCGKTAHLYGYREMVGFCCDVYFFEIELDFPADRKQLKHRRPHWMATYQVQFPEDFRECAGELLRTPGAHYEESMREKLFDPSLRMCG